MSNVTSGKDTTLGINQSNNLSLSNEIYDFKRCWEKNVSEQFPIKSFSEKDGITIAEVGNPHEGFYIKTAILNGKLNGNSVIFSGVNTAVARLTFVDGVASGPCILNDESGVKFFEGRFENGFRQGRGKEFDLKGNLEFDGFFDKGKKLKMYAMIEMGQYWKEYDEEGKLISITQRDDFGRKEGVCYFYNDSKEISRVSIWKEGREVSDSGYCEIFDEPRKVWYKGFYKNGLLHGRVKEYNEIDTLLFDGFFNKGKKLTNVVPLKEKKGYWKEYDEEGKLISITQRDDFGRKEGICYFYNDSKEISRVSIWKEGREVSDSGYCEIFDEPRKVWYKGYFDDGKLLNTVPSQKIKGYWEVINCENKVVRICEIDKNGRYEGINYIFHNSKISRISEWKEGKEIKLVKQFNEHMMTEYTNGHKSYEGEYLDSIILGYPRNGKGEEYCKDEKTLIFKGNYRDGRRHGKGISYKKNTIKYERNWIAGYTQQGLILTLCAILVLFILAFLLDIILGIVLLSLCCFLLLIRWKFSKFLSFKICNATNIQLMADYVMERCFCKVKKNELQKKKGFWDYIFDNIYLSLIVLLICVILCVAIPSYVYHSCTNPYVSIFQTQYTVKFFSHNKVTGFKLSRKPFLKSIQIGNECFTSVSLVHIEGLNSLLSISIGINSFTKKKNDYGGDGSKNMHILNCKHLQSIEIGEYSFSDYGGQFTLKGLPSLQSLLVGKVNNTSYNFYSVNSFTLQGILSFCDFYFSQISLIFIYFL